MRLLSAGSDGLLVEVADLDQALALFSSLRDDPLPGVVELVPAARTVLVRFDPDHTGPAALGHALQRRPLIASAAVDGVLVEVPVHYDGEDLSEVARLCGLDEAEVVRRHTATPWTVAFTGFAPGFAYLSGGDPGLDVPRRSEPRTVIPAGSVALAGPFSGVYPRASPGGWQLLGRTSVPMWDLERADPALLRPGMRVRFVDAGPAPTGPDEADRADRRPGPAAGQTAPARNRLEILSPGALTVVVDLGRPGRAAQGVARSGAVDRGSLRRANRLVGNPADLPALEIAAGGFRVRASGDLVLAVTGAPAPLSRSAVDGAVEEEVELPGETAFALDDGEELQLATPGRGVLSYLAVRGGLSVGPVLGSASTDLLAGIGPAPLRAADEVAVGSARASSVALDPTPPPELPAFDEVVEIDVLPGPRDDWFTPAARKLFATQEWAVTPRSNRVGLRLEGAEPLERARAGELPSEGTVPGAVQIPPNGQPVVFTADHPVTGGYPVIACVAAHHLDRLGQVPVGGRIRFRLLATASSGEDSARSTGPNLLQNSADPKGRP
ncbi:MAG: allophanate hydrolase [Friedmanniella sp.]|nr:allophanate hydrolase [Friedmanniella sp.]